MWAKIIAQPASNVKSKHKIFTIFFRLWRDCEPIAFSPEKRIIIVVQRQTTERNWT